MLSQENDIAHKGTAQRSWAARSAFVALTLLRWTSHPPASSAESPGSGEERSCIRVQGDRASVDVEDVSLSEVLSDIASRAGIKLVMHGSREEKVSARFHSVPLDEALRRLSRGNFLLLYSSEGEGQVAEVWIGDARMPSSANSSEESRRHQTAPTLSAASARMKSLVDALRSGDTRQRRTAVWQLGDYQDATAREALTVALATDADAEVRQRAAWLLEFRKDPEAVSALTQAVSRDPDESVRQRAVESLAKVGGQEAVGVLSSALRDPALFVRYEALASLSEIGGPRARASLIRALRDPDELVRGKAAELLADQDGGR